MKAIVVRQWCEPRDLVMEEVERPVPGAGQVGIRVQSAALNFPDVLMAAGKYQVKPRRYLSRRGLRSRGRSIRWGRTSRVSFPASACWRSSVWADSPSSRSCPAAATQAIPDGMTDDQAAAFPLVYQTSYVGLVVRGALKQGETVLVHSAAGGVGLAAVQIARALGAGKIIGTAGSNHKLDLVRQQGADVAINYQTEDFVEVVKRETDGRGADVIYDPVGGEIGQRSTKCIAFEGRLLIVGFTGGAFSSFVSNHILLKNYSVMGVHWGSAYSVVGVQKGCTAHGRIPHFRHGRCFGRCTVPANSDRWSAGRLSRCSGVADAMEMLTHAPRSEKPFCIGSRGGA